ncbi:DUF2142 domain-containing protein [Nitrospirillum iridis]|uniref:Putative membrane protein n=1 Tax=Nitrospirillum iridis TaxID=765888 RepID=A0A7X0ATU2_9PROT|nr:DUF2142 domain-containing protein [Nitrospirillum iridis]MBB6249983.1 putative membrane protein [Nitrospirillum iridis]
MGLSRRGVLVAALYFLVALASVLTLSSVVPPFEAPDEPAHFLKADSIARGQVRPRVIGDERGGEVDGAILRLIHTYQPHITKLSPVSPAVADDAAAVRWSNDHAQVTFSNTAQYGPFFYLPQAVTLVLGRLIDLSVDESYRLARVAGALTSILLASAAIALASWGRPLLVVMLLTPMYLFLTVSVSQDGLLISVAALYAALLTRLWSRTPETGWLTVDRTFLVALACAWMLALARPPYMLLALLLVHPRGPGVQALLRRRNFLKGLATPLLAPAVTIASAILWLFWAHVPGTRLALDPTIDAGAQLKLILTQPWRIPLIIANSGSAIEDVASHIIGVLGWLSIVLHSWAYAVGWWAIALAAIAVLLHRSGASFRVAGAAWPIILTVCGGIALALYVTWTPVGASRVLGMQGRYFSPLFSMGVLALPSLPVAFAGARLMRGRWVEYVREGMAALACAGMVLVLMHGLVLVRHAYLGV